MLQSMGSRDQLGHGAGLSSSPSCSGLWLSACLWAAQGGQELTTTRFAQRHHHNEVVPGRRRESQRAVYNHEQGMLLG